MHAYITEGAFEDAEHGTLGILSRCFLCHTVDHSTRSCTDQCYIQGSELCRKPSFLFTSSLRRSLDWPESVVCLEECAGGPGCSEQFPASWQHLQSQNPALEPGQEMAGEVGPDGISDLTL